MFNDILLESQQLYDPSTIQESINELKIVQRNILKEASLSMLNSAIAAPYTYSNIIEADAVPATPPVNPPAPSFIQRLIIAFKRLITKIKEWFDNTFRITERRVAKLVTALRGKDYKNIAVEAPANINSLDVVIKDLNTACDELATMKIDSILETIKNKSVIGKALVGIQLYRNSFLNGYVNVYKKYNGWDVQRIKEDIFGVKKIVTGIDVTKFETELADAKKFRGLLDKFSGEYESILNRLNLAVSIMAKTKTVDATTEQLLTSAVHVATEYYNRNINLIASLTADTIHIVVSTASKMAAKAGIIRAIDEK